MTTRHNRHRSIRMRAVHPMQLVLPLLWSRDEVRASLVVLHGAHAPEPVQARLAVRRAA